MGRGRPPKCPYCGSTEPSVAKGFRYNRSGIVRLRRCKSCQRRWTLGPVTTNGPASAPAFVVSPRANAQSIGEPEQLDSEHNLSNQSKSGQEDTPHAQ